MKIRFFEKSSDDTSKAVVEYLNKCFDAGVAERRKHEADWMNNELFLQGDQWEEAESYADGVTRKVLTKRKDTKARITTNQILPLVRQAAAALRENIAQQVVLPATDTDSDVAAAKLSTDFLHMRFYQDDEETLRFWEILHAICFGRVLRKVVWDTSLDGIGPTGKVMKGAGDIRTYTVHPDSFVMSPFDRNPFTLSWVIETDVWDIDEINSMWPGADVRAEDVSTAFASSGTLINTARPVPNRKHSAILRQAYFAPDKKSPNGMLCIWANGKLLHKGDLPDGIFPFVPIDWMWIPGRSYPLSFISPLRDLQKELNVTLSQLVELRNRQLRGDLLAQGHGEVTERFLDSGQKIVQVPPSMKAELMRYDLNTRDAESIMMRAWNDMMQIAGIHEQSLGQAVQREVTATQVQMLKESDLRGLELFREGFDKSYCQISRLKLELAQRHYTAPRLLRVMGETDQLRVVAFYGSDLSSSTDVVPRAVPMMTEMQRQMLKQQLIDKGAYGPYNDIQTMKAGCMAIINSGLPNAMEEVERLIYPMTYEELLMACGELTRKMAEIQLLQAEAASLQVQMQIAAAMQAVQPPDNGGVPEGAPVDQNGVPIDDATLMEPAPQASIGTPQYY